MKTGELAALLGVTPKTVRVWARKGIPVPGSKKRTPVLGLKKRTAGGHNRIQNLPQVRKWAERLRIAREETNLKRAAKRNLTASLRESRKVARAERRERDREWRARKEAFPLAGFMETAYSYRQFARQLLRSLDQFEPSEMQSYAEVIKPIAIVWDEIQRRLVAQTKTKPPPKP